MDIIYILYFLLIVSVALNCIYCTCYVNETKELNYLRKKLNELTQSPV